ncbi:MAG: hypothetical protein ACR2FN_09530 [Chitinophagaceae bacterium]
MRSFNYKKTFLIFFAINSFLIIAFYSCSQSLYGIQKSYAYTKEIYPGNIPVGENGKPLIHGADTVNIIYLETKTNDVPVWSEAWKNRKPYNVTATAVKEDSIMVGETKTEKHVIIITPQKGNYLWQLQLEAKQLSAENPNQEASSENKIILIGEFHGKKIMFTITKQIELLPEMRP